jgi:hypothetical protein
MRQSKNRANRGFAIIGAVAASGLVLGGGYTGAQWVKGNVAHTQAEAQIQSLNEQYGRELTALLQHTGAPAGQGSVASGQAQLDLLRSEFKLETKYANQLKAGQNDLAYEAARAHAWRAVNLKSQLLKLSSKATSTKSSKL